MCMAMGVPVLWNGLRGDQSARLGDRGCHGLTIVILLADDGGADGGEGGQGELRADQLFRLAAVANESRPDHIKIEIQIEPDDVLRSSQVVREA